MSQSKSDRAEKKNEDGKLLCELKQYDNAKKFFDEAIQLNPNIAKYWNNRAACHIMMGNYFLALGDSKKSVTIDEKYAKGYKRLSKCNKFLDDLDLALKYIETAQKLDPGDKTCSEEIKTLKILKQYDNDIKNLLTNDNFKQVLQIIEKYLKVVPESKKYRLLNAECLILLQDFKNSAKILYSVLNVMPNDEDALYVKGLHDYYKDYILKTFEFLQNIKRMIPDNLKISKLYRDAKQTLDFLHQVNEIKDDKNQLNDAYVFLDEALKIDPRNYNTNKKLLYQKITIADRCPDLTSKIIPDCTEYLTKYEKNLEILKIRAQQYMDIQEYEDAVEDYEIIYNQDDTECKKQNEEKYNNAKKMFEEQLKSNYKILKIEENEIDDIKIKKSYEKLLKIYNNDLKSCSIEKTVKDKAKIDRISKAFKEIMKSLESDEDVPKTALREAPRSVPRKASGKFSAIQRAKKCISQQNFTMASELLNKFSLQSGASEETIYTQTSLIYYEKHILDSFELVKQYYEKIPNHVEIKKLFEKAEKTYKLFSEAIISKDPNKAYKLFTDAQKIDPENHITNKDIFRKKIELGQKFPALKYNVYKDCSLYLTKYGPDLEILQIRANHSLNIGEFEDAIDDFKELLSYESSETNEQKLNKAKSFYAEESKNSYKILRIDESVQEGSKIKKAFQDLLLLYHPDKNSWASPERKNKLEKKLFRVKDAYEDIKKKLKLNI